MLSVCRLSMAMVRLTGGAPFGEERGLGLALGVCVSVRRGRRRLLVERTERLESAVQPAVGSLALGAPEIGRAPV